MRGNRGGPTPGRPGKGFRFPVDAIRSILTTYDETEVRCQLAWVAGLGTDPPGCLLRSLPMGKLTRLEPDGAESPLEETVAVRLAGDGTRKLLPLEVEAGQLWGYWEVPEPLAGRARDGVADLVHALRHLERIRAEKRVRREHEDMLAIFDLGHVLAQAGDPARRAEAIHAVARQVLGATNTCLALLGQAEGRLFSCGSLGGAASCGAKPSEWQSAFPERRARWRASDPEAAVAAFLLGTPPAHGMVERISDDGRPLAYLLVQSGGEPFTERAQGLFGRMADALFVSMIGREQLDDARRKSRQVTDLFVLLAQEKERLDYVMRSVPVGLLLAGPDGAIDLANEAAGKALGLTDVELREKKIFGSRTEGRELLGLIQKAKAEGRVVTTPYEMEGRWFHLQVVPWPGGMQFLVVAQDIQDWHQLNRLKEDLISIISHEIKNPLTAVINASHLLASGRTGVLTEAQRRIADLILENSRKIKDLLDDVVRLSRVYQLSTQQERVPLKSVLEKLRAGMGDTIQGKLIVWREELADVTARGEEGMLENLFTNLVGNAVKYTGIGGHVGVRLWPEGGLARFRVCDDGPGVPAKERERIFSPFFRASNVREQVTGTGLGLVIAKNIVERLGGRIALESPLTPEDAEFLGYAPAEHQGTAFQVDLPLEG